MSLDAARDQISVELPGIENPERARRLLQTTAKLEFWDVYRAGDPALTSPSILNAIVDADGLLKNDGEDTIAVDTVLNIDTAYTQVFDSIGNVVDSTMRIDTLPASADPLANRGPLLRIFTPNFVNQDRTNFTFSPSVMGVAESHMKNTISSYLADPAVMAMFPKDLEFRWAAKPVSLTSTDEGENPICIICMRYIKSEDLM